MKNLIALLGLADKALLAIIKWLTITLFLVLGLIVTANILLRIFPVASLHWVDEIVELSFAWLVFYAATAVWTTKGHFSVGDWFGVLIKNERTLHACRLLVELASLLFAVIFFQYSLNLTLRAHEVTSVFQIPKAFLYSCMPIATGIMVAYSVVFVVRRVIGVVNPQALKALEAVEA